MVSLLLTARPLNVPPLMVISAAAKPVGASLKVKVMVAVWPVARVEALLVMARVGATVSILIVLSVNTNSSKLVTVKFVSASETDLMTTFCVLI